MVKNLVLARVATFSAGGVLAYTDRHTYPIDYSQIFSKDIPG